MRRLLTSVGMILGGALVGAISVYAYTVLTVQGTVNVDEAISVTPNPFTVPLFPNETFVQTIQLSNAGSEDILVFLSSTVSGPTKTKLTVTHSSQENVAGNGIVSVDVTVVADADIEPGAYLIALDVER